MTAIWHNNGKGWDLLSPSRYPDEATLHKLVEEAPQMLPLSGSPKVIILGRELELGTAPADFPRIWRIFGGGWGEFPGVAGLRA